MPMSPPQTTSLEYNIIKPSLESRLLSSFEISVFHHWAIFLRGCRLNLIDNVKPKMCIRFLGISPSYHDANQSMVKKFFQFLTFNLPFHLFWFWSGGQLCLQLTCLFLQPVTRARQRQGHFCLIGTIKSTTTIDIAFYQHRPMIDTFSFSQP